MIFIGVGAVAGLYLLNLLVVQPYRDNLDAIDTATASAQKELDDGKAAIALENKMAVVWKDMKDNGLKADESQADTQLEYALSKWAQLAGFVNQPELRHDPTNQKAGGVFPVVGYNIKVTGTQRSISQLIWALETAKIPIRISNLTISPQPEGTDNLTAHMDVDTLAMPADINNPVSPQNSGVPTQPAATQQTISGAGTRPAAGGPAVIASPVAPAVRASTGPTTSTAGGGT
jgi:hypothetical protein